MRRSKGTVLLAAALAVCTLFSGCKKVEQGEQSSASIASHAADAQQEDPTDPIDDWTRQETGQKSVAFTCSLYYQSAFSFRNGKQICKHRNKRQYASGNRRRISSGI